MQRPKCWINCCATGLEQPRGIPRSALGEPVQVGVVARTKCYARPGRVLLVCCFMENLMPINVLGTRAKIFAAVALSLALASCGSNTPTVVCNAPRSGSGSTCTCGTATAACPINPGPEFLYAYSVPGGLLSGGLVLAFSIDHNSGALTALGSAPGPFIGFGLVAVNNQFLYASDAVQSQLDGFSINQGTGVISILADSPFANTSVGQPVGLASPPSSNFLYAAAGPTIDGFSVSPTGTPAPLPRSPYLSPGDNFSLAVDPSGKFLYSGGLEPPGGISAFTIGSSGTLTGVPGSPFVIPGQTVSNSQPQGIVATGSFVYAALFGTNQIAAFSIVSGTGALIPVPNSPFAAGPLPSVLVTAQGFLYAINSLVGTMSAYSIDSASGTLTPLSGSPFGIGGSSMAADSFGSYLYVASSKGIQAFSIDSTTGALNPLPASPYLVGDVQILTAVQIPPP